MEETVILIIKAANQSTPDQRMQCDAQWSVSTLKGHLSKAHPSHPNTEEQRLIYSGQLLADHHLLCNILRRPSEDNAYTIHLVCSPPPPSLRHTQTPSQPSHTPSSSHSETQEDLPAMTNPPPTTSSSSSNTQVASESTDGVRRRHPTTSSPPTLDPSVPPTTTTPTMPLYPVGGVLQPSADPMHQVAAMQQIYAQYMAYVQYMQMGGGVGGLAWPQQMIQIPPPPNPATATTAATTPTDTPDQPQPDLTQPADPQPHPQPQQPIRMNAQGGEVEDDDDDDVVARDWLDWVYVLCRMMVLLSIVYFYSTLSRFMVVVFIAMLLYLYQAGWFRPSRRVEPPAPQAPNPPNQHDQGRSSEEEEEEDEEEEEEEEEELLRREEGVGRVERSEEEMRLVVRPSLLSLSWTFLSTFFTSLIPEQPQGI